MLFSLLSQSTLGNGSRTNLRAKRKPMSGWRAATAGRNQPKWSWLPTQRRCCCWWLRWRSLGRRRLAIRLVTGWAATLRQRRCRCHRERIPGCNRTRSYQPGRTANKFRNPVPVKPYKNKRGKTMNWRLHLGARILCIICTVYAIISWSDYYTFSKTSAVLRPVVIVGVSST